MTVARIAAGAYGVLLLGMASGQLSDLGGFARILADYELFGGGEPAAARGIAAAEIAAGAALLVLAVRGGAPGPSRLAGLLGIAIALFWTTLASQAFARGLTVENCGCFGVHLGQELRFWVLAEDAYLLLLAWYAARGVSSSDRGTARRAGLARTPLSGG